MIESERSGFKIEVERAALRVHRRDGPAGIRQRIVIQLEVFNRNVGAALKEHADGRGIREDERCGAALRAPQGEIARPADRQRNQLTAHHRRRVHTVGPNLEDHLGQFAGRLGRRDALADRLTIGLRVIGQGSEITDKELCRPICGRMIARSEYRGTGNQYRHGWDDSHRNMIQRTARKILKITTYFFVESSFPIGEFSAGDQLFQHQEATLKMLQIGSKFGDSVLIFVGSYPTLDHLPWRRHMW